MNIPELYIIIPCYNEEKVLPITCSMFLDKLQSLISRQAVSDRAAYCLWMTVLRTIHGKSFANYPNKTSIILAFGRAATAGIRILFWQV